MSNLNELQQLLQLATNKMVKDLHLTPVPKTFEWEYTYKHDDDVEKARVIELILFTKKKKITCGIKPEAERIVRSLLWDITTEIRKGKVGGSAPPTANPSAEI